VAGSPFLSVSPSSQHDVKVKETDDFSISLIPFLIPYRGSLFAVLGMGTLVGPLTPLVYLIPRRIIFDERILSNFQLVLEQRQMARLLLGLNYSSFCYMCAGMFTRRVREEEAMMKKHFGSDYEAFLASRWRIFPGIL
jgi:protein-S-isoprenylcysteine O-methyltransferase Ste14